MLETIKSIKQWFIDRELDELKDAYIKVDRKEEIDAVGDLLITIIGYCLQRNLDLEYCLKEAYEVIKNRKGEKIGGVYVKESDLKDVVIVYTAPGCIQCKENKKMLERLNIKHILIDVSKDKEALEEIKKQGFKGLPVVRIGMNFDNAWYGFRPDRLEELLK